jgi:transcriptional regulator with XRE-family HTH domain
MDYKEENVFTGNKIKSYRLKNKWTQGDLASRLKLRNNTISAYERGQISIPHAKLLEVARVLDVKTTDLLPIEEAKVDELTEHIHDAKSKLTSEQLGFLELLIAKTNSLEGERREAFLKNLEFAVKFFDQ